MMPRCGLPRSLCHNLGTRATQGTHVLSYTLYRQMSDTAPDPMVHRLTASQSRAIAAGMGLLNR